MITVCNLIKYKGKLFFLNSRIDSVTVYTMVNSADAMGSSTLFVYFVVYINLPKVKNLTCNFPQH